MEWQSYAKCVHANQLGIVRVQAGIEPQHTDSANDSDRSGLGDVRVVVQG